MRRLMAAVRTGAVVLSAVLVDTCARALEVEAGAARYYGSTKVLIEVRGAGAGVLLDWQASVQGGIIAKGSQRLKGDGPAQVRFELPAVKRRAEVTVMVQSSRGDGRESKGSVAFEVFPPYDWARLGTVLRGARVGVAELKPNVAEALKKAGVDFSDVSQRLGLQAFEGDIIIVDGRWLSEVGAELSGTLKAKLAAGARVLVIDPEGDSKTFCYRAPETLSPAGNVGGADPASPLVRAADLIPGRRVTLKPFVCRGNFRPLVESSEERVAEAKAGGRRVLAAELWPPAGGYVLVMSCGFGSVFAEDPSPPLILEGCLNQLGSTPRPASWRPAACAAPAEAKEGKLLASLGVKAAENLSGAPAGARAIALVPAPRPTDGGNEAAASLGDRLLDWIRDGGTAVVFYRGCPPEAANRVEASAETRGLTALRISRLAGQAGEGDAVWQRPMESDEWQPLIPGLIEKGSVGQGKCYMLRMGPVGQSRGQEWDEFLSIFLTNLGIRLIPQEDGE